MQGTRSTSMTDPTTLKLVDNIGAARGTDYFLMKEQLTKEEVAILEKVRKFGEAEVLPVVNPYWERGEFPFELVPKIAALNIVWRHNEGLRHDADERCRSGADQLRAEPDRWQFRDVLRRA